MKHSFSIILLFICLLVTGLFFLPLLPIKLNPSHNQPRIYVSYSMYGQSARIVEMEVTSKLEGMLSRIKGVEQIDSYSDNGRGHVSIRLNKHVKPEIARFEASTIVRQLWPSLPDGVSYPYISMSGVDDNESRAFINYTINAPILSALIQQFSEKHINPRLALIQGVDKINIYGATPMEWKLEYDYIQLRNLGISVNDITSSVQSYLSKEFLGSGKIINPENGEQWIRLALVSDGIDETFDGSTIQVTNKEGKIYYLNQLVKISRQEEEPSSYFRINGLNSIYLSVVAKENANQLELSKQVKQCISGMREILPAGYELHLTYDSSVYIQEELDKIYLRSGLTILILLCFVLLIYRNLKYLLLIVFSLLANISIAFIFYYLFGLEIQLYSLVGITISLTLIIDNTIVMSDQIIHKGNKKAFLAILAATLTTMASLVVIFFMDEKVRLNLQDFAAVIIINLGISLAIALFLVPALIDQVKIKKRIPRLKKKKLKTGSWLYKIFYPLRGKRRIVRFNRVYEHIIYFISRFKKTAITLLILLFGLPVFLLPDKLPEENKTDEKKFSWTDFYNQTLGSTVYKEKIKPVTDVALGGTVRLFAQKVNNGSYYSGGKSETMLQVTASLPNGTTLDQMNTLVAKMEDYIRQYDEVYQFETNVQSGQQASIQIRFVKEHQNSGFPYQLKSKLISKSIELGGGSWSVYGVGDGFSNDVKEQAGSMRVKVLGYNYDELYSLAETFKDSLLTHRRIKEVTIDSEFSWYKKDYQEYVVDLDEERMAEQDLYPQQLFRSLNPLFGRKIYAGNIPTEFGSENIRLYSQQSKEFDIWNLKEFPDKIGEREYKLQDIASIKKGQMPQKIARENQQYLLCLQYEYIGAWEQSRKVLEKQIKAFEPLLPLGYKIEKDEYNWWNDNKNAGKQYGLILLIIAIVFMTTSMLFNSLKQPLVVIFIIPISFIGLFLTFYWFKLNFDQGGFAAFVMLCGLTVNASIYVLNEYNNLRSSRKLTPVKAYIKAWNAKIIPILLTILSTVLGFIPFMVGSLKEAFWFPLAAGTIGGLIMSLIGIFLFLPVFMGLKKTKK